MRYLATALFGLVALGAALTLPAGPAAAAAEPEELVEKARLTTERLLNHPEFPELRLWMKEAKGVLILPSLLKAGFVVGGEGGSGVLMVRGTDGSWSDPAFYTLAGASIGLQIGGEVSEVVFTLMTDEAVASLLDSEFKFGGDISVAIGPKGAGIGASSTTNVSADIYAFSKAVGLFGGGALNGAKIFERSEWNQGYYGPEATPKAIVIERKFSNPQANKLRDAIP